MKVRINNIGDEYIADVPESFDKALNEKSSNGWEDLFDMQTKLVTHYVLENEKLKDKIKELEKPSEKVDKICNQIEEIYRENEYKDQIIKDLRKELERCFKDIKLFSEVNVSLRKEIRQLETLLELNMKDLWDIADQRDWYYEEYQKLKDKEK